MAAITNYQKPSDLQILLSYSPRSKVWNGSHRAKIKVLAGLLSFLEALGANIFSGLFQLMEATHIPWLMPLPSSKPAFFQKKNLSYVASLRFWLSNLPFLLQGPLWLHWPPPEWHGILFLFKGQLISIFKFICNINSLPPYHSTCSWVSGIRTETSLGSHYSAYHPLTCTHTHKTSTWLGNSKDWTNIMFSLIFLKVRHGSFPRFDLGKKKGEQEKCCFNSWHKASSATPHSFSLLKRSWKLLR